MNNKHFIPKSYVNKGYGYKSDKNLYTIIKAGHTNVTADFCIERDGTYPYNNIHIVMKGKGMVEYKTKKYPVKEGELFILNAFDAHVYESVSDSGIELLWVEFTGGDSTTITKSIIDNASPILTATDMNKISKYINKIISLSIKSSSELIYNDRDKMTKYLVSKLVYSMLIRLYEYSKQSIKDEMPIKEQSAVMMAINFIEQNIGDNLEVERLAGITHFSQDYFSKMFKKVTGESPAKYVCARRIVMAKELLCDENAQIDEIAYRVGFYDSSHFIKTFKKAEGLTPAEFRKQSILYKSQVKF